MEERKGKGRWSVCAGLGRAEYKRSTSPRRDYEWGRGARGRAGGGFSWVVYLAVTPSELAARPPTCGN